jgi:hypothetical protein
LTLVDQFTFPLSESGLRAKRPVPIVATQLLGVKSEETEIIDKSDDSSHQ